MEAVAAGEADTAEAAIELIGREENTEPRRFLRRYLLFAKHAVGGSVSDPEGDPALGQIVRRDLQFHPVAWNNSNEVLAHLPADMGDDFATDVQLDPERGIRQCLLDPPFNFDRFFLGLLHAETP